MSAQGGFSRYCTQQAAGLTSTVWAPRHSRWYVDCLYHAQSGACYAVQVYLQAQSERSEIEREMNKVYQGRPGTASFSDPCLLICASP